MSESAVQHRCSGCNRAVAVVDGEIIKACRCDAPVVGEMSATAKGVGGLKG